MMFLCVVVFGIAMLVIGWTLRSGYMVEGQPETPYNRLDGIVRSANGGVFKRIDEGRELLALLDHEGFLAAHPWVEGWIQRNDEFLAFLANEVDPESCHFCPDDRQPFPRNSSLGGPGLASRKSYPEGPQFLTPSRQRG